MNDQGEPQWGAGIADHITVELHNNADYYTIEYTAADVALNIDGTATVSIPATFADSYYVTIRHRNSLETTSAAPVDFSGATISQSFADPMNVFGGNVGLTVDLNYVIYAGDVNQDGSIDSGDYIDIDNDSFNYIAGYNPSDVNGDGTTDSGDYISVDNNGFNYIGAALP
jgi:hypothetical protein